MSEIASILRTQKPRQLSADEEQLKRALYEKISPRRRKFIDRIGYENWDPFPEPNEPNDIRTDITNRTVQQLTQEFVMHKRREARRLGHDDPSEAFLQGAMQAAAGIVNKQDKFLGTYEFAAWYYELLKKEGYIL
jgi:hypothetical protein